MVEAAGIEPASGSTTLRPLHAYAAYCLSEPGLPTAGRPGFPSPSVSPRGRENLRAASLLNDACAGAQATFCEARRLVN
jgi:hypothetical protein